LAKIRAIGSDSTLLKVYPGIFFLKSEQMDYSKYIQMKMEAANTYKSNWQGRDASEVTLRKQQTAQSSNSSGHRGPNVGCVANDGSQRPSSPTNGFSTDYSLGIVSNKIAGGMACNDAVFGQPGGVNLKSCAEVSTILTVPANPRSSALTCCSDPGVKFHQVYPPAAVPSYTGTYNNVPTNANLNQNKLAAVSFPSN
jgi:hypothetical protein